MLEHFQSMYAFYSFLLGVIAAQVLKPVLYYFFKGEWNWHLIFDSGGFPSSHTSGVCALTLSIGIHDGFSSNLFAVVLAFSIIVMYDAANVRYYAGKNIQITQQLIKDIQELTKYQLNDPIYLTKVKNILGHKWIEVFGGGVLGCVVAFLLSLLK